MRSFVIIILITTTMWACQKDADPQLIGNKNITTLSDVISDSGITIIDSFYCYSASDSSKLRDDNLPITFKGFLPSVKIEKIEIYSSNHFSAPLRENFTTYQRIAETSPVDNMLNHKLPSEYGNNYLIALGYSGDTLYRSEPIPSTFLTDQTNYTTSEVYWEKDEINRIRFITNFKANTVRSSIVEISAPNSGNVITLHTSETEFSLIDQFEFGFSSKPDVENPSLEPGEYNVKLFFLDRDNLAIYKQRFDNLIIE
ncbi:hypothetical protein [Salibacter halophilus]|uniref:Uncharacterized protein n=1 Tax=Salibacter halophilus TaxID=1803916 RepID=A0A6N6MA33_9FLAO|nr:hypothetical protein [Salibacter halophilus]KAB1065723.1 hypothetical protein F3059_03435 [Salibacter halophilus]